MRSNRGKGMDLEVKVCEFLEKQGWSVWRPPTAKFGRAGRFSSTDIFGVFDILASNKQVLRFIQVKTADGFREKVEKDILDTPLPEGLPALFVVREYWIWTKRGARIRRYVFQKDHMVRVEPKEEPVLFTKFMNGEYEG